MDDELKIDRRGAKKTGSRIGTEYEGHRGNLPYVPTDNDRLYVERMAGLQVSQAEIAMVMGVNVSTIQKYYAAEFERGRALQGMKLRAHAYDQAYGMLKNVDAPEEGYLPDFKPNPRMTEFLLERQFGMVQQSRQEHVGNPDQPVEIRHIRRVVIDPKAIDNGNE